MSWHRPAHDEPMAGIVTAVVLGFGGWVVAIATVVALLKAVGWL